LPDLVIGRRDSGEDDWHWYPVPVDQGPDGKGPRRSRTGLLLAAIGAVLTGVGMVLLVLSLGNDSSSGSQASPTALRASAAPATAADGETPAASPTPARSLSPASPGDVKLFIWSRQQKQWLSSDLVKEEPGYQEGDVVPFMLKVEQATPATLYEVRITYVCRTTAGAAFDYLASPTDADNTSLTTAPGPARREDASIPVPDDSAIGFDGSGRRFKAWVASFRQAPEGPSPDGACQASKWFTLSLMTQGATVFLVWGGHLASKTDWGANQGASSQRSPIFMEVTVGQAAPQKIGIGPDAIGP
jgi:hypothetical protein